MIDQILFNKPYLTGNELNYISEAIQNRDLSGNGRFTRACEAFLEDLTSSPKTLMTPSCTAALEMAAILLEIKEGDEIIMSSFNFVSAANAFVLRGAKIIFVDIRPDTMNIDENLIEQAITSRTKAIVTTHYAGVACNMDKIMAIARHFQLFVIEDAAHCIDAYYHNNHLGSIGDLGTVSFHSTKNIHCGEGGALLINDHKLIEKAEIIQEKGTDRKQFQDGKVSKYSWIDIGSSFLLGELNAAFLFAQLHNLKKVTEERRELYQAYYDKLNGFVGIQVTNQGEEYPSNGHIFHLKCKNFQERSELIYYLSKNGISACFHYIPLHTAKAGLKHGLFKGKDKFTTIESERILRLPIYYGFNQLNRVCTAIEKFYG